MSKKDPLLLKFQAFSSAIEVGFWRELTKRKLEEWKLAEAVVPVLGAFTSAYVRGPKNKGSKSRFVIDHSSFDPDNIVLPLESFPVEGTLQNMNTMENFKGLDKREMFTQTARRVWADVITGKAAVDPFLLSRFLIITFADLKRFQYCFLFGSPALPLDSPAMLFREIKPLSDYFSGSEIEELLRKAREMTEYSFVYLLKKENEGGIALAPVHQWKAFWPEEVEEYSIFFFDPSPLANAAGWPLRNVLFMLAVLFGVRKVNVVSHNSLRDVVFPVLLGEQQKDAVPESVGWEPNLKGRIGPRFLDLQRLMDPMKLAENAVDLNIKLMKWRLMPSLQTARLSACRCLLLGAGTLGCAVARTLLGYGVRTITFVDSGTVSYSNPVRQSLYHFSDSVEGLPKAKAAAIEMQRIFPSVNASGHQFAIPMPGHPEKDKKAVSETVQELTSLIQSHDVVFLLTDTRESRWLPTILCAYFGKLAMNAALGFDTFLVMRHGIVDSPADALRTGPITEAEAFLRKTACLGCYFCSDIVAPTDSTTQRALDQQCTITRPSLAAIAGSLAVELFASVLHHPLGGRAPANADCELGIVPHQIRGFLSRFENILLEGQRFESCSACGANVLNEFHSTGMDFLHRCFDSPTYLEEVSGLAKLKQASSAQWMEDELCFGVEETMIDGDEEGWLLA